MRIIIAICTTIVFFSGVQCYGQDNICSDLLRHGIYDHFRETGDSSSYSRTQKELCESYSELQRDIKNGSVKASYKVFSGKASFSREHLESVAKQMCSNDFSESSAKNMIEKASSMINPGAIQAYRECIANSAVGLKSKTEYTQDDIGVKNITLTVYYAPDKGMTETPVFNGITMSPKDSFECSGDLCGYKKGDRISTSAYTTSFTRKIASAPFEEQGRKLYASAGSITVSTSAGAITRQVTPVYAPPPAEIERRLTEAELKLHELEQEYLPIECEVYSKTSPIGHYPSITMLIPEEKYVQGYRRVGGGCRIYRGGESGIPHNAAMLKSIPVENGWLCQAGDPPNIPLNTIIEVYVISCRVPLLKLKK